MPTPLENSLHQIEGQMARIAEALERIAVALETHDELLEQIQDAQEGGGDECSPRI